MVSGTPYSSTWNATVPWGTENLIHIDQYTYPGGTISDESPCVDNSGIVFSLAGTLAASSPKEYDDGSKRKEFLELNKLKKIKINDQEVRNDGSVRQNFSLEGNMIEVITTKSEMKFNGSIYYNHPKNIKFITNHVGDTIFIYEKEIGGNYHYIISSGNIGFNEKLIELLY